MEKIISTLVWAALIQGVLLAVLYLFSKKYRSLANRLLGLFLLIIVYEGTINFLPFTEIFGYRMYYFALPEVKLLYPLLFFHFILEKVGRTRHYRKYLRFHYWLAAAIAGVTLINVFLFVRSGDKIETLLGMKTVEQFYMVHQYYAYLLIWVAFILSIIEVLRYKRIVKEAYSDFEMLNIGWLWRFTFALLPIIIAWGADLTRIALGWTNMFGFELVTWFFVVIFIYGFSFEAFQHQNLFERAAADRRSAGTNGRDADAIGSKPGKHVIGLPEDQNLIRKIQAFMETEEPYLDASLSIHQLARKLGIPVRELSLIINLKLQKHFFDFINEYRIKKAMELLRDPGNRKVTILEILYEVGFNSKSSFNTAFKKYTGKTPTQYREASLVGSQ